jgi:hypothetical protein
MPRAAERFAHMAKIVVTLLMIAVLLSGCDQNTQRVDSGERLEDAAPITPSSAPPPLTEEDIAARMTGAPERMPIYKVFFMHRFIEALYSVPKNSQPNPAWQSPLKDPENGRVWCTDCHRPDFDFANMPSQRHPETAELEQNHEFMVELMTKWVGRLNSEEFRAKAKLKEEVKCTTCHAKDPRL